MNGIFLYSVRLYCKALFLSLYTCLFFCRTICSLRPVSGPNVSMCVLLLCHPGQICSNVNIHYGCCPPPEQVLQHALLVYEQLIQVCIDQLWTTAVLCACRVYGRTSAVRVAIWFVTTSWYGGYLWVEEGHCSYTVQTIARLRRTHCLRETRHALTTAREGQRQGMHVIWACWPQ